MNPRRIAFALALAFAAAPAGAEILSLHAAWLKAMSSEPAWRMSQAEADIDKEDANKARSGLLPQIGLSGSNSRNSLSQLGRDSQSYDASSASLTLRQPLFRMQTYSEYQRAGAKVEQAEFRLGSQAHALAVRVAQGYFEVLQSEDAVRYSTFLEKSLSTHVDAARKAFRSGSGTRIEIDEARARHAAAAADRQAAENARENAKKRLSAIVGSPVAEVLPLDEAGARNLRLEPGTFSEWLDIARQHSPDLAAAGKSVEETSWAVSSARAGHLPTVDLVMSRARAESDTVSTISNRYTSNSVGVQFNLPLFSGGYTSAETAQARARHQRALASRDNSDRELETRLLQEFNGVLQGEERLASLNVALEASEEALRSTRHGVVAGTRTSLDVLNAERQLYSARVEKSRALYDWIMSRLRLKALAGTLDETEIKEVSGMLSLAARGDNSASVVVAGPATAAVPRSAIPRDSTQTRRESTALPGSAAPPTADTATSRPAVTDATPNPVDSTESATRTAGPETIVAASDDNATVPAATPAESPKAATPGGSTQPAAPILPPKGVGAYAVSLGTFGNPENVTRMLAATEKLGIAIYTEATGTGMTRVRAGPFATRSKARDVIKTLAAAGVVGVLDKR